MSAAIPRLDPIGTIDPNDPLTKVWEAEMAAHLQSQKLNVRKADLSIAAIALECHAIVVTRNLRDFSRVPDWFCDDWSMERSTVCDGPDRDERTLFERDADNKPRWRLRIRRMAA
jgi:hypothetical protein